ncbi:hypothetical protein [Microbulbifer thermotolerans]|uniref:Uncharacterized protein n=1 Tax=Microbulbifer thermotolerans TaxID=252514 RepID=A0A143HJH4_MICTH|nr:hypothetical protein [Microbulbifer thermotolerans]AMX01630.1 hypothetical protein A3224_02680 [Microbulbifer thermotolerans]MCX2780235.1 hypothetical protein [Microbulbifer thermotolerans]MCX2783859.1 hypothetical protein [Microbulbifer thermotolerans]MCX2795940.1 hypothetical protein [Microbulbifer thermotolerans]MCX2805811.1 hypothetical protein [Microbulbifer thermotolerans]
MRLGFFRADVRRLLLDTLVVLIGVLAALLVNNIREEMVAKQAAREATDRLLQEMALNAEELRSFREMVDVRLSALLDLRQELPADKSLRELIGRFHGYRILDLDDSSWEYLSHNALASSVDPELLHEAFALYSVNAQFEELNGRIHDIVYSELFVSPDKVLMAIDISEAVMRQQLRWADELLPKYERFLDRYSGEEGEGKARG